MRERTVDKARGRWSSILSALGVDETFTRNRHGPCPFCGGKDRYRFDDKDGNGTWFCNNCGSGRGIEFVMKLKGCNYKEACELIDPLISNSAFRTTRKTRDYREVLRGIWKQSTKSAPGGIVDTYLSRRGLELPLGLRETQSLAYFDENRNLVGRYAAMIAPVRNANGDVYALHFTYLENGEKIKRDPQKKLSPKIAERADSPAVRLYEHGDSIAIAEGIETAIAFRTMTGIPCWAATNANNLAGWNPPDGVKSVTIAADNDRSFTGHQASGVLAFRLAKQGYSVSISMPQIIGYDWNDVLLIGRKPKEGEI